MVEQTVDIRTAEGAMPTTVVRPETGGPFPVVLYMMDAVGIRPTFLAMARRLAQRGYYVMAPDLFYLSDAPKEPLDITDPKQRERMFSLVKSVTVPRVVADTNAMLAYAKTDAAADPDRVGSVGFCMGAKFALAAAQSYHDVVKAAASLHGGRLVADGEDSPHRNVDKIAAELYFGWADEDQSAPKDSIPEMEKALNAAGITYHIDFMTGAKHGYTMSDLPSYNRDAAEAHWQAVLDLFARRLQE